MAREAELEMAERHVRQGEASVARQSELVSELHADGHDTKSAEELLTEFETILGLHREHLECIARAASPRRCDVPVPPTMPQIKCCAVGEPVPRGAVSNG